MHPLFFSSTSGVANERNISNSLSRLLREKRKNMLMFSTLSFLSLLLSYFSFIIFLSFQAGEKQKKNEDLKKTSTNIFLFHLKNTHTRDTLPSWQPWIVEEEGFVVEGGLLGLL